jgi:hypothetical protein
MLMRRCRAHQVGGGSHIEFDVRVSHSTISDLPKFGQPTMGIFIPNIQNAGHKPLPTVFFSSEM